MQLPILYPAIRQLRHNNSDGFVMAYDRHETDKIIAGLIAELDEWRTKFHDRCEVQLDEFRKAGMTEAAERCIEIAGPLDEHVATMLRKEFPLPKAG
jgi:hypothetical protein